MSRIPPGKVLVKAGVFKGGKLPYVNYVGQVKPTDMPAILWWGAFGSDVTGDGSIAAPFETFPAALAVFRTTTHRWILNTDLSVYGEAGAGAYIDDPADRVYLDPTRPDDSGNGLTSGAAKKTYAAAKTVLGSSGRSAIHCVGSFTLSNLIDTRTQGEVGETLTYDVADDFNLRTVNSVVNRRFFKIIKTATGRLLAIGQNTMANGTIIFKSDDDGETWSSISNAHTKTALDIATNGTTIVIVGVGGLNVLISTDDGDNWTAQSVGGSVVFYRTIVWTGTNFVIAGSKTLVTPSPNIETSLRYSPDGLTWSAATASIPLTNSEAVFGMASDGAGKAMLVGNINNSTSCMFYSADDGVNWTDYSSLVGVGSSTGGIICEAVEYRNGYWFIFQDTVNPAVYYSNTPTTAWSNYAVSFHSGIGSPNQNGIKVGYSAALGGFVYAASTAVTPSIKVINQTGITQISTLSVLYNCYGSFVTPGEFTDDVFFFGDDNAGNGVIIKTSLRKVNIFSDATNMVVDVSRKLASAGASVFSNLTAEPAAGEALNTSSGDIVRSSRLISDDSAALKHFGNLLELRRNLIKGTAPSGINGVAAVADDIEITQNLIVGDIQLNNAGGTDKEKIQDNIVEGDFLCAAITTINSNIRGAVTNSAPLSKISTINPIFADTTDYFLSRIAFGQAFDSPLVNRSAAYNYDYNGVTYKDDFGPYRAFAALIETTYKRAFLLPKFSGNALSEDVENSAALMKSINGVPDVSNRPNARLEIISWASKTVDNQVREFIDLLEREKNTQVELYYDFNETVLDDIVVNGAHSSGTFEVNIVPKDVPVGAVLAVGGLTRYVVQRFPRSGDAEKIVLDDVLVGGLADGQNIEIEQVQGAGTFLFVPEKRRQNKRVFSRRRDTYSGMQYTFARKKL